MGWAPKFPPGGAMSHQSKDGRINRPRPQREGDSKAVRTYTPPEAANSGNWIEFPDDGIGIDCGPGGKGHFGDPICHQNEAPFPEKLAEFFVRSFCPPGGLALDIFGGSGTTSAVCEMWGRDSIYIDLRESQAQIAEQRIQNIRNKNHGPK